MYPVENTILNKRYTSFQLLHERNKILEDLFVEKLCIGFAIEMVTTSTSQVFIRKWAISGLLFIFKLFTENIVGVSGIRTRIVGTEGEYADH